MDKSNLGNSSGRSIFEALDVLAKDLNSRPEKINLNTPLVKNPYELLIQKSSRALTCRVMKEIVYKVMGKRPPREAIQYFEYNLKSDLWVYLKPGEIRRIWGDSLDEETIQITSGFEVGQFQHGAGYLWEYLRESNGIKRGHNTILETYKKASRAYKPASASSP